MLFLYPPPIVNTALYSRSDIFPMKICSCCSHVKSPLPFLNLYVLAGFCLYERSPSSCLYLNLDHGLHGCPQYHYSRRLALRSRRYTQSFGTSHSLHRLSGYGSHSSLRRQLKYYIPERHYDPLTLVQIPS